jgi:hypothetical protein
VGAVVLLWGVVGLLDVRKRQREFRDWRQRRRAPKSPHEKEPNIGRPPDRNPLFRDCEADLERLAVQLGMGAVSLKRDTPVSANVKGICGYLHLQ